MPEFKYTAICYYVDSRFGLSVAAESTFKQLPSSEEIEQLTFETAADVVRVYRDDDSGKRILKSEYIYHDFDDAGEEGEFLYDDN